MDPPGNRLKVIGVYLLPYSNLPLVLQEVCAMKKGKEGERKERDKLIVVQFFSKNLNLH